MMDIFENLDVPEDAIQYMFVQDLMSYFMVLNNFPLDFQKAVPEKNRHLIPRGFSDVIKIATGFLYCRISVFNTFRSFERHKVINTGTFLLFCQQLESRYFSRGYNPQKFLYFCSHLVYMATRFYKKGLKEVPVMTIQYMVRAMKIHKLVEPIFWNGLNVAAFRYLKIGLECGFVKSSALESVKIQFVINQPIKNRNVIDIDENIGDKATTSKQSDFRKQSAGVRKNKLESIIDDKKSVANIDNQVKREDEKPTVLDKENFHYEVLNENNSSEIEKENLTLRDEVSCDGLKMNFINPSNVITKTEIKKKAIPKQKSFVLKELNDLMNKTVDTAFLKMKERAIYPKLQQNGDESKLEMPVVESSSINENIENMGSIKNQGGSLIHSRKNSSEKVIDEKPIYVTGKQISNSSYCVENSFHEHSSKYKASTSNNDFEKFSIEVNDMPESETKNFNKCKRTFLTARNNGKCSFIGNMEICEQDMKDKENETEHFDKSEGGLLRIHKENTSETATNFVLKNENSYKINNKENSTQIITTHKKHLPKVNLGVDANSLKENELIRISKSFDNVKYVRLVDDQSFLEEIHEKSEKNSTDQKKGQDLNNLDDSTSSNLTSRTINKSFDVPKQNNLDSIEASEKVDYVKNASVIVVEKAEEYLNYFKESKVEVVPPTTIPHVEKTFPITKEKYAKFISPSKLNTISSNLIPNEEFLFSTDERETMSTITHEIAEKNNIVEKKRQDLDDLTASELTSGAINKSFDAPTQNNLEIIEASEKDDMINVSDVALTKNYKIEMDKKLVKNYFKESKKEVLPSASKPCTQNESSCITKEKDEKLMSTSESKTKSSNFTQNEESLFNTTDLKALATYASNEYEKLKQSKQNPKLITAEFNLWEKFVVETAYSQPELELYGETFANFMSKEDFFNSTFDILTCVHYMAINHGSDVLRLEE